MKRQIEMILGICRLRESRFAHAIALISTICLPLQAQFAPLHTKLKPQTTAEFQAYVDQVEMQLKARWNGNGSFLELSQDSEALQKVMSGELLVRAGTQPNPHAISDGLIHDWYGAVFIPNAKVERVVGVLEDFDHHSQIYPRVEQSRLIKRSNNDVTGYWRLEEKGQLLPATFDVTLTAHYQQVGSDKWFGFSHSDDIRAVENDKDLPSGEGIGLMWKLYSYWSLTQLPNGVLAECRSISLSRGVPNSLAWMIRPFVNTVPRDSMESTLKSTRNAVGP